MATITASTQAPAIKDFIRGGTYTLNITITNSDGTAFNLTGSTVYFTVNVSNTPANDGTDSTAILKASTSSFSSPATGIAAITLSNTATGALSQGTYYYDVKLKDSGGNTSLLGANTLKVIDNITTRTS